MKIDYPQLPGAPFRSRGDLTDLFPQCPRHGASQQFGAGHCRRAWDFTCYGCNADISLSEPDPRERPMPKATAEWSARNLSKWGKRRGLWYCAVCLTLAAGPEGEQTP